MTRNYLLLVLGLVPFTLFSQHLSIVPIPFSDPKEIGGRVNCIFQDKTGFIWIGSETGLYRYDGNVLKPYRFDLTNPQSIGSNNIRTIIEDADSNLWIGTRGGGLNHFNRKKGTFTRYLHNKNNPNSISFDEVEAICPDDKGCYWIGTDGGGLNYFDPKTGTFQTFQKNNNTGTGFRTNQILSITPTRHRKLWVTTWGGGLHLFDQETKQTIRIGEGTPFAKLNAFSATEVKPGKIWIATYNDGVIEYDIDNNKFSTVVEKGKIFFTQKIRVNSKGEVYVSSFNRLFYFTNANSKNNYQKNTNPDFVNISEVFIDRYQNVWVGTESGLIGKINSFRRGFQSFPANTPLDNGYICSVSSDTVNNSIDFITPNKINVFNLLSARYKTASLPVQYSYAMANVAPQNAILFNNNKTKKLELYNKKTGKISAINLTNSKQLSVTYEDVVSLHATDSLHFWVADVSAAYKISPGVKPPNWQINEVLRANETSGISKSHYFTSFLQQTNGDFWVGTWGGGINRRLAGKQRFTNFVHNSNNKQSISNNFVFCMHADPKGYIWIGTQAGLNRFNPKNGTFSCISVTDGLADDWISGITSDASNRIWVSTRQGLSSISNDMKVIRNYGPKDELPNYVFLPRSVTKDLRGYLYFGSKGGIVKFHPDSILHNQVLAQAVIVDFKINDIKVPISSESPLKQAIEVTREIRLQKKQNSFAFQLAALSFTNPKMNRIKYKLNGYDNNWQLAGANQIAAYFGVPPGNYTFTVLAANDDGIWNPSATSVKIVITQHPLLTPWALLIYFLALCPLVIFFAYKYRKYRIVLLSAISNKVLSRGNKRELIQPSDLKADSADNLFLQKALLIVEQNMADPDFGVEQLCNKMFVSQPHLYRKINSIAGVTVSEFIKEVRLKRAAQLLQQKSANISEVAYEVGFNNPKYFSKCFKQQFGVSPRQYSGPAE